MRIPFQVGKAEWTLLTRTTMADRSRRHSSANSTYTIHRQLDSTGRGARTASRKPTVDWSKPRPAVNPLVNVPMNSWDFIRGLMQNLSRREYDNLRLTTNPDLISVLPAAQPGQPRPVPMNHIRVRCQNTRTYPPIHFYPGRRIILFPAQLPPVPCLHDQSNSTMLSLRCMAID